MVSHKVHFYNNSWHKGKGSQLSSHNPCSSALLWSGFSATEDQVAEAVASAREGFTLWSGTPLAERIHLLKRYQDILKKNKDELANTISDEVGKPRWEAATEANTMIGKIDLSLAAYEARTGERQEVNGTVTAQVVHKPHGVMAVLGPYNFPGHLANGHIVPALLAGNSIVFKPSEYAPLVGEKLVSYLLEAGLPSGVINLVQGGAETGAALAQAEGIDGLLFTGSSSTGKRLHALFGGKPEKMLALEMGGNNPLIVHEPGDEQAAIYNIIQSAYISAGQRCTCARRLIMVKSEASKLLLNKLVEAIKKIKVACPAVKDEPFMGPVIANHVADKLLDAQQQLYQAGGKIVLPMERIAEDRPLLSPGLIDVSSIQNRPDEELFGPLLQLIWVDSFDQAIAEANNTRFGLAAGILTDNDALWQQFFTQSRAGVVNRNRPMTGASGAAPFGGIGASGNHRPSAYYAADYCAFPVASLIEDKQALPPTLAKGVQL